MAMTALVPRSAATLTMVLLLVGCGGDAPEPATSAANTGARPAGSDPPVEGLRTFVIVPAESRASYRANEEFFGGALNLLGIEAGKIEAVGSTSAVEGQFELDPERPDALAGTNSFSVRVNTFTSNQSKRDDYVREIRDDGGPSFDAYPVATFNATAIDGQTRDTPSGRELNLRLTGDLTVREITKPVTFDAKALLSGATLTGVSTTRVLLSDFGIGPIEFSNILKVGNEVTLEVQFTARAQ
ncbi:MAG: YceI family protein [Vicinamibacterales bacterium]